MTRVHGWEATRDAEHVPCLCVAGDALFQTHENLEHLAMMEAVLGPLPEHMARSANRQAAKYFTPRCAPAPVRLLQHARRSTLFRLPRRGICDGRPVGGRHICRQPDVHRLRSRGMQQAVLDGCGSARVIEGVVWCTGIG